MLRKDLSDIFAHFVLMKFKILYGLNKINHILDLVAKPNKHYFGCVFLTQSTWMS